MKILLVEDDELVGEAITHALNKKSYTVNWVQDGESAITALTMENYSLILLDLGLPGPSGSDVLEYIRQSELNSESAIMVITARDEITQKVRSLDSGADDYLVKPFSIDELHARIRAVTRRMIGQSTNTLAAKEIILNLDSKTVSYNGLEITLTSKEYALIYELISRPGIIVSRKQLEERLYGWNEEVSSNAVEFIIHGLRKKISKDIIKNIRGLGWMISKN